MKKTRKLNIKVHHKIIVNYYAKLKKIQQLNQVHEGAVSQIFAELLSECCDKVGLQLVQQYSYQRNTLRFDGAVMSTANLRYGIWEAKDCADNLEQEIIKKFEAGYPQDNILFQTPDRAILYQAKQRVFEADLSRPADLIQALQMFLEYTMPEYEKWEEATEVFKEKIPDIAESVRQDIRKRKQEYEDVAQVIQEFQAMCEKYIAPNISESAIEEMIIQHLLTERIFLGVLRNSEFFRRNPIAQAMEKLIVTLTQHEFSREDFLNQLENFYLAIEKAALSMKEFAEKQKFLTGIYERFFQGFSKKVADTHGIVYTPHEIVEFMVNSVEEILKKEFGKSLSSLGVNIIDPFVGTGNFIVHLMQKMPKFRLMEKYQDELWCNEIMLMPYYIAAMNIEHAYYEATGEYHEFNGICFVDTFKTAEENFGTQIHAFGEVNSKRVSEQCKKDFFVILGNPPYNAHQANENDNNKNQKHETVDSRVRETYTKKSSATLRSALSDPYVKAFRWAGDRLLQIDAEHNEPNLNAEGVIAYVSNNSFVHDICFDGMRQCLQEEFDSIYVLDLGGNVRKRVRSEPVHNVFGIRVGVCITLLIRTRHDDVRPKLPGRIFYARLDEMLTKEQKLEYLQQHPHYQTEIQWQEIRPNSKHLWLTQGLSEKFDTFLPIGTKQAKQHAQDKAKTQAKAKKETAPDQIEAKLKGKAKPTATNPESQSEAIIPGKPVQITMFGIYSLGICTNRDAWVYNFNRQALSANMEHTIDTYNEHAHRYQDKNIKPCDIDNFVSYDDTKIKWSETLKQHLSYHCIAKLQHDQIRVAMYRPFCKQFLYWDNIFIDRPGLFPRIFPTPETEQENQVICLSGIGSNKPFHCLMTAQIPCLDMIEKTQCFPFYIYQEDGSGRTENIPDQTLQAFQEHYRDSQITKWDIFYYTYAVLLHPEYAKRYAQNLRHELPRIPYLPNFRKFAEAGKQLAELHIHYEQQPEYCLQFVENPNAKLDYRVETMRFNKDKTAVIYNNFLTLAGIPPETFEYRLGSRSALEWIVEQYAVTTDQRSQITNDPNDSKNPKYIIQLIGKIITVSLKTLEILSQLQF